MLTRMLRRAVEANPAKTAIVQGSRRVRYDELEDLTARCAAGLRTLGITSGDCVAVILPNGPEFVTGLFACAMLRAVMLPLNPQSTKEELLGIMTDARAKVVVTDSPMFASSSVVETDFNSLLSNDSEPAPSAEFSGPVLYLYTSGSTDTRKRLCCTQENLFHEALNFVDTMGLTAADNILCTIPLYHSYGLGNCLLDAVYSTSTLVFLESDDAPFAARCGRVMELIQQEAIRFYPGVPYQFQILSASPELTRAGLSTLKLCVSSGDVLPRLTYDRFLERFGLPIRSLYGSTEAGSISINTDPDQTMEFGSLGAPLKNVTIRICNEVGRDLPDNASGHIWVKSPVIPPNGYDNRPELSAQIFRDGYYNTGDIGKKDARGHLVMTGRKQTFVDVEGFKVDLTEVEEVLQSHPHVREAAALPVEAINRATLIKAVVVTEGNCLEAEIRSFCRERLAPYKIPRLIEFRDALPRSPLGKVLKSELQNGPVLLAGACLADFEREWRSVATKDRAQQIELLAAVVQEQAALTLQRKPASIARSDSFHSLGFDSLLAAELHLRLLQLTGLPLPITMLWNYPSIEQLADALWARISARPFDPQPQANQADSSTLATTTLDDLLREVDRLSETDVDALFAKGERP